MAKAFDKDRTAKVDDSREAAIFAATAHSGQKERQVTSS